MVVLSALGPTIGSMIKAAGMAANVKFTDDEVVVSFKTGETPADAKEGVKKTLNKKRRSRKDLVTAGGKTLSIEDWAKKEKVTVWTICYRLNKYGTPLGTKKPTNKDKILMGS